MFSLGLRWAKVDFHVHTPGSADYEDKTIAAKDIVSRAKELQLDVIAVTDHNTGDWVDKVKLAAKGSGVTVFPGVEITVMGGKQNIHMIALFDPSRGTGAVNDLLAQLKLTEAKRGNTKFLAEGDLNQVIAKIAENGALPILAHSDSDSGLLADTIGEGRISVVRNPRLVGAEITKIKTRDYLDGNDPNYQRQLGCYQSSDSHSLETIGRRCSFLKMGAMSLAAVRQCLEDPETRIRLGGLTVNSFSRLVSMTIKGGFCDGIEVAWHEGLNCLIGGKGVGKSLIVEFTRFVLNQPSDVADIRTDMYLKLEKQLGLGGHIKLRCVMAAGTEFEIARTYDGVTNPIRVFENGAETDAAVERIFPLLAYSQGEAIDIARDPSIQLRLIDRLLDVDEVSHEIEGIQAELATNCNAYVTGHFASERIASLSVVLATEEARIKEFDKVLGDPKFTEKKKWDQELKSFDRLKEEVDAGVEAVQGSIDGVGISLSQDDLGEHVSAELTKFHGQVEEATKILVSGLTSALKRYETTIAKTESVRKAWDAKYKAWDVGFQEFLLKAGGQQAALSKQRSAAQKKLDELKKERKKETVAASGLAGHRKNRETLLDRLDDAVNRLHMARSAKYEELTKKSNGRLRLTVDHGANRAGALEGLVDLCQGMQIGQKFLADVVKAMPPRKLVEAILDKDAGALQQAGLSEGSAGKLCGAVKTTADLTTALELAFRSVPQDVPHIEYQKDDGEYYPLAELSVGQKCTALLIIALSEGEMPILIDQPEDALDVATVYQDVVQPLRAGKDQRQFVLTTHNANVAVSSDSDKFHVLKGTATSAELVCAGAIDVEHVAKEVLTHLEGGIEPYKLRGRKYNISG